MAELEGLRIYVLVDEQATYSPNIVLAVDDSGFTNTKKVKIGTIYPKTNTLDAAGDFNPATSLVRLDNGSGEETKATVNAFLTDSDVITTLKTALGLNATAWLAGNRVSSKVNAGEFIAQMANKGGFNTITGTIKLDSQADIDEILFTLHNSMPTCTQRIYFNASDDSPSDENYEMYIEEGTRNVRSFTANSSTESRASYCLTYPAI